MSGDDFGKVDRALEMQVIDWLQWNDFVEVKGKPDYPKLALELIYKRKLILRTQEKTIEILREELTKLAHQYEERRSSMIETGDTVRSLYQPKIKLALGLVSKWRERPSLSKEPICKRDLDQLISYFQGVV